MSALKDLFNLIVFPGCLFLFVLAMAGEFIDRRLYARFQNRLGPPWFQPIADFIKLVAKEETITEGADRPVFWMMPVLALTSVITAFFYIPLWGTQALFSFKGDVIVVLYLMTIPTLTYFLGGWYSRSVYSMIGAVRVLTQLFAYEAPLFMSVLSPVLLSNTWSLSEVGEFYYQHPFYWMFNLLGFCVGLIALIGKLEKVPFDTPEAETEIVAGSFTEYSGKSYAFFRLAFNVEMIVGASLLAAVFLPFWLHVPPIAGFFIYILKVLFIIAILSTVRSVVARLRIDQMINLCWKYFAPAAILQVIIVIILKKVL
jgi:NADH-quinone oxidoreductase subunit H